METQRTDCTNEAEENQSSSDVLDEVWLTSAVESSGRLVLLVVVRRLGHAAGRISFWVAMILIQGIRTVQEAF
jgi:hypothetical protein